MSTSEKLFFMSAMYTAQVVSTELAVGIGTVLCVLGAVALFVEWLYGS